ncbi:hypothetical protein C8R43DRAFT_454516 [Mycena crocata]|nr:hypothetical protein C8R43DRAFT_454516 [Mycena crocata]
MDKISSENLETAHIEKTKKPSVQSVDPHFEKKTIRHIDWRLLSLLSALYAVSLMDRSNFSVYISSHFVLLSPTNYRSTLVPFSLSFSRQASNNHSKLERPEWETIRYAFGHPLSHCTPISASRFATVQHVWSALFHISSCVSFLSVMSRNQSIPSRQLPINICLRFFGVRW